MIVSATCRSVTSARFTDVIGPIEPALSNIHHFILVAIDYITKWVEQSIYKVVTTKVVADFVWNNIICRFGIPEFIITDNATNLNCDLMRDICEKFRIVHHNSITYGPQINGAVEVANKNIKMILRKIVDNHRQWHKKLPFALLGYLTTMRNSTGATPYMLVYDTEAVIPAEVEIPSLRVIQEAKLDDPECLGIRQLIREFVNSKPSARLIGASCTKRMLASSIEVLNKHRNVEPFLSSRLNYNAMGTANPVAGLRSQLKTISKIQNLESFKSGRKIQSTMSDQSSFLLYRRNTILG
nr:uncharacterized protein K02A2.6-like [Nicotiana tomentosiformis]